MPESFVQASLPQHARVVIIGGGIAGCSTLYHLCELGCSDTVLIERDELTSGSTWHAAAQVTQFGASQTMQALKQYSIGLYRKLAQGSYPINYHITGGMRLGYHRHHRDLYQHFIDMAQGIDMDMELIDGKEAGKRHPLLNPECIDCAWWDPLDGDIDPAQLCFALAHHARKAGAHVVRNCEAQAITAQANGEWRIQTNQGVIVCEKWVNASGYRVNEVGAILGVTHPVVSMEHQYFLTEPVKELQAMADRVPIIRDPGDDFYCRQEKQGLLVGIYEQDCRTFGRSGIPTDFSRSLCAPDLERCLEQSERILERLPCLKQTGIHTVINGPITYSADGSPIVGPIPGHKNAYACIGLRAGIGEGGGLGKMLAEIMLHGQAEWDSWCLSPYRFCREMDLPYTEAKAIEEYKREFHYDLPHEERPAGRPLKTGPLYENLLKQGADFRQIYGWERARYFKPDSGFEDQPGYRFNETFALVAEEISNVCRGVGIMEVCGFNRYRIYGAASYDWLCYLSCSNLNLKPGQVKLAYLLNHNGRLHSEATIAHLADGSYWYGSAAAARDHDLDWLRQCQPAHATLEVLTEDWTTLVIAGPKSITLLQALSNDKRLGQMPWLHALSTRLCGFEAVVMSVSYSGELAYELHVPNEAAAAIWSQIAEHGQALGLGLFGTYAAESMRMEKGYRHWKSDLIDEYGPYEAGLSRFIRSEKSQDFIGKKALLTQANQVPSRRLVDLVVQSQVAPCAPGASIGSPDGKVVGTVTSAAWGHRTGKNLAAAYVDERFSALGTRIKVTLLGSSCDATVVSMPLYDPHNRNYKRYGHPSDISDNAV